VIGIAALGSSSNRVPRWNVGRELRPSLRLDPANLITLAHFSVSSAASLSSSAGEPASTMPPTSASRALMSGSARPALTCPLSLSMISIGVLLGALIPKNVLAS